MTALDHTQTQGLSGAPLSAPISISHRCNHNDVGSTRGPVPNVDQAAGLALPFRGEGLPADAGPGSPAKDARPAALPFELAAVLCGHDPTTAGGAHAARHDFRVWDLIGRRPAVLVIHHHTTQGARP